MCALQSKGAGMNQIANSSLTLPIEKIRVHFITVIGVLRLEVVVYSSRFETMLWEPTFNQCAL
jgi:hypothetical protein